MPRGPAQTRALLAFQKKYAGYKNRVKPVDYDAIHADPVSWIQTKLGDHLWSKQREIIESVRDNRRTAVKSCHSSGKSFLAARIAVWWIESHPPGEARVITSAPTGDQVKLILWQEIGRAHTAGKLRGRLNQTEWWFPMSDGREEMVGVGRKPSDYSPTSFQGIHERYVLLILDEACGFPASLWTAAEGLLSNDECRLLSIGNPDDPLTEFYNECKPGSGTNVIKISAFDTPNFTGEEIPERLKYRLVGRTWVEEKKVKWGIDNPFYIARVLGEFPEISSQNSLIPLTWVRQAQERDYPAGLLPNILGLDVGGGADRSSICWRQGPLARIVHRDQNPDTMQTLGTLMMWLQRSNATRARVDYIGIGKGVVDRAKEIASDQREPLEVRERAKKIVGVNVGLPANDTAAYANLKAEIWWGVRELFQSGEIGIDPKDEDLAAQLVDLRYKPTSTGKVQIESKKDMKMRLGRSPDDADALALACMVEKVSGVGYSWG